MSRRGAPPPPNAPTSERTENGRISTEPGHTVPGPDSEAQERRPKGHLLARSVGPPRAGELKTAPGAPAPYVRAFSAPVLRCAVALHCSSIALARDRVAVPPSSPHFFRVLPVRAGQGEASSDASLGSGIAPRIAMRQYFPSPPAVFTGKVSPRGTDPLQRQARGVMCSRRRQAALHCRPGVWGDAEAPKVV